MSARFTPAARTRISISSGLIAGSATSPILSAFSSPGFSTITAFMTSKLIDRGRVVKAPASVTLAAVLSINHLDRYLLRAGAVIVKFRLVERRRFELGLGVV